MMKRTERFRDLTAVNAELIRLEGIRDGHAERLEEHFQALKHSEFRKALVKNTVKEVAGNFAPAKLLASLFGGGGIGSGLTMALGAEKGGIWKRMGMFALGLAAPKLLKTVESISLPDVGHELMISWERLKDHMEQRREEKRIQKEKKENAQL